MHIFDVLVSNAFEHDLRVQQRLCKGKEISIGHRFSSSIKPKCDVHGSECEVAVSNTAWDVWEEDAVCSPRERSI